MHSSLSFKLLVQNVAPQALLAAFLCSPHASAQTMYATASEDHIVSSQAMQQPVVTAGETRRRNIKALTDAFDSPAGKKAMGAAKADPVQVKNALPTLSDEELANLSGRVTKAQSDFSAGLLGIGLLTLIILVVILVIVVSAVH